ncbi:MAG TPA: SDR family oxidoreductase [Pseudomonadales bacterium]
MPIALVTGATNGIGTEIARGLAAHDFTVYVHGRSMSKADAVCADIKASTGNTAVYPVIADFDSLNDVKAMATEYLALKQPLDVLVNNAGVVTLKREQTRDGFERMFGVNYLAHYQLTRMLLPALRQSAAGRVVNLSSGAHAFVKGMNWDDLQYRQGFKSMRTYGHSKLANLLFTRALAAREPGLHAYAAHPGAVSTGLGTQNGWIGTLIPMLLKPFFRTPAQGASTALMLATQTILEPSGSYFANDTVKAPAAWGQDDAAAERLWCVTADLLGLPEAD